MLLIGRINIVEMDILPKAIFNTIPSQNSYDILQRNGKMNHEIHVET
jgi:hypothetical protein